jgi:hypothetical protein
MIENIGTKPNDKMRQNKKYCIAHNQIIVAAHMPASINDRLVRSGILGSQSNLWRSIAILFDL